MKESDAVDGRVGVFVRRAAGKIVRRVRVDALLEGGNGEIN